MRSLIAPYVLACRANGRAAVRKLGRADLAAYGIMSWVR